MVGLSRGKKLLQRRDPLHSGSRTAVLFFFYQARSVLEYCCTRQRVSYSSRVQQRCYFFLLPSSLSGTRVLLYPPAGFVQQQYNSSSSTAERRITFCSTSSLGTLGVCTLFTDSMLDELLIALYCTKIFLRIKSSALFSFFNFVCVTSYTESTHLYHFLFTML